MNVGAGVARRSPVAAPLLVAGFALAVWLRVAVGGPGVAASAPAGLTFAAALGVLTLAGGPGPGALSWRAVGCGVGGAAVLCLPPALLRLGAAGHPPAGGFAGWAAVVVVVATAEEAFLRGALYRAVEAAYGAAAASAVGAVCFAALHVPLYGWHVVPLDLAVGLWLGALRRTTGTWTAPALTHGLADLAAWFLR